MRYLKICLCLLLLYPTSFSADEKSEVKTLRIDVRMVEVYASVFDRGGKYLPGLRLSDFRIVENGAVQSISSFESSSAALTLALLVDTTGSMLKPLPHVKNAVADLLGQINPKDRFGLFAFNNKLQVVVPFTKDRRVALRSLFRLRATGSTALFDSLAQLAPHLARITGKKAILLERLSEISKATGGVAFTIRNPEEIGEVFSAIVEDLKHLYLLGYYPPATINSNRQGWRRLQVLVPSHKNSQVRAKEGYLP